MKMSLSTGCFALVLILALGAVTGCIRSPDKEYGGTGEILSIGAYLPIKLDRVVYTFQGQNYVITPQEEGMTIAVVRARAVNQKSIQVTLSLDEDTATLAAILKDNGRIEFSPFDPGLRAVKTSEPAPKDNPYGSHLWGHSQVVKGFEIAGYFFFDVPEDAEFADLVWDDVEYVRVPYPK